MSEEEDAGVGLAFWLAINNGGSRAARMAFLRAAVDVVRELESLQVQAAAEPATPPVDKNWFLGDVPGDPEADLLGITRLLESLTSGVEGLLRDGNSYAAAALVRQMVEVEYLFWAFAQDHDEARNWRKSTQEQRRNRWQPRHLRERSQGRFRGSDYARHCEMGGHPTPAGFDLLRPRAIGLVYWEASSHLESAVSYLLEALANRGSVSETSLRALRTKLTEAAEAWRTEDMLTPSLLSSVTSRRDAFDAT